MNLTISFAIFIFLILAAFKGPDFSKEILNIISSTISIAVLGRLIFIKWVWKWLPFLEWIHGVPNIEGKWSGKHETTWRPSPDAPVATGPIEVKITQPDLYTAAHKLGDIVSAKRFKITSN